MLARARVIVRCSSRRAAPDKDTCPYVSGPKKTAPPPPSESVPNDRSRMLLVFPKTKHRRTRGVVSRFRPVRTPPYRGELRADRYFATSPVERTDGRRQLGTKCPEVRRAGSAAKILRRASVTIRNVQKKSRTYRKSVPGTRGDRILSRRPSYGARLRIRSATGLDVQTYRTRNVVAKKVPKKLLEEKTQKSTELSVRCYCVSMRYDRTG